MNKKELKKIGEYTFKITCIAYTHETYYVKITCIAYTHETYYVKITCIAYTHTKPCMIFFKTTQ